MKSTIMTLCFIVLACVFSSGCYSYDVEEVNNFLQEVPAPVSGLEYRIYPPDVLTISSKGIEELQEITQMVRPDGKVNLPLVGEISVADKTATQIEAEIASKAREYYEQVDVRVVVSQFASQHFFVFGQVGIAGRRVWTGRDTLLSALADAQPTFLAWPERIILIRGNDPQVGGKAMDSSKEYKKKGIHPEDPDDPRKTMTFNLLAMIKKGDLANNVFLQPGDAIYVQPNPYARIGLAIQTFLFPARSVTQSVTMPSTVMGVY